MEKVKVFILKSPVLMAIMTFVSAFVLTLVLKLLFGAQGISLEKTVVPLAIASPLLYTYTFKEQISKLYRIKYALIITLLYALSSIFIILHLPELAQPKFLNMIITLTIVFSIGIYFGIYYITGRFGRKTLIEDYQKTAIAQKNLPIEEQKQRKKIVYLLLAFMTLTLTAFALNDRHIINIGDNLILILGFSMFGIMFFTAKHLKKTSGIDFPTNIKEDKD